MNPTRRRTAPAAASMAASVSASVSAIGFSQRVMDRIDPSLLGLCLDMGHFRFGGADPTQAVHDDHELIRHPCANREYGSSESSRRSGRGGSGPSSTS